MQLPQRDLHQRLRTEALANHERVATLARRLDPEQLVRRPAAGGWSVGEVLEHLCRADEAYLPRLTNLVHHARRDAGAPAREWKASFFGNLIATTLEKPRPVKSPKIFRVVGAPRTGVVEDFLARDRRVVTMMDDAATIDWRNARLASPALPVPIIRMNLGDVFRIHVVHVRRHLGQMERVTKELI